MLSFKDLLNSNMFHNYPLLLALGFINLSSKNKNDRVRVLLFFKDLLNSNMLHNYPLPLALGFINLSSENKNDSREFCYL